MQIKINEIFQSISGEAGHPNFPQGTFCTFIRFQGCSLRCNWCDTPQSHDYYSDGQYMEIQDIVNAVSKANNIVITGGEPTLQQSGLTALINAFKGTGKKIQIETNGTHFPIDIDPSVTWVMDYKLPSSGMEFAMLSSQDIFTVLSRKDTVLKFVFNDVIDIEKALDKMKVLSGAGKTFWDINFAPFILSPTPHGKKFSKIFVEKIFEANLQNYCIFSLQSHKLLDLK